MARAVQRGRAVLCEPTKPCACHLGTRESMVFYARRTPPNLTACSPVPTCTKRGKPHRATPKVGLRDGPPQLARALVAGL